MNKDQPFTPESQEAIIKREQLSLLYDALPTSVLITLINACIISYILWPVINHHNITVWIASAVLISAVRLSAYFLYRKAGSHVADISRWERYHVIGVVASGMLWGGLSLSLFPADSIVHQAFIAFVIAGMSAGAVTTLSALQKPAHSFLILSVMPLIFRLFEAGGSIVTVMAVMTVLFLIFMIVSVQRSYSNIFQNIALRLQSQIQEQKLAASEERFQNLANNSDQVFWTAEPNPERVTYVSPAFERIWGEPAEKLYENPRLWSERIHPDDQQRVQESFVGWLTDEQDSYDIEYRIVDEKADTHWIHDRGNKTKNEQGELIQISGVAEDITARKLVEQRLRKLSLAIEQMCESVIIVDRSGTIEYVNRAFTQITGYSVDETLGKKTSMLKSGKQSSGFYKQMWLEISSGRKWSGSVVDRHKDGSLYPALLSIAPIIDESGDITHYVGILQDMTEHDMLEEKFRQAQKMEALGTLVGGIAHDFNNMLAGMTGNLYLARMKLKEMPDVDIKLQRVEELSFRASEMIQQLLTFARKGLVDMKPFGLTSFIKDVSKLSEASIPKSISFDLNLCSEELVVQGDATQLQQVMMNLLNNAQDAVSGVEKPRIHLRLNEYDADQSFIDKHPDIGTHLFAHMVVEDNGCGIEGNDQAHVFEPFYTTKEVGVGTGLGLSMAYGAIDKHGGLIEIESTPEQGTAVHIYLPLKAELALIEVGQDNDEVIDGKGELILVVDDNANVRSTAREVLENIGYRILEAKDGLDAVNVFSEQRNNIALVLMDIVMPRMGGVKASEQIRVIKPDVHIVFATGYDKDETLQNEMPVAGQIILSKPYSISILSRILRDQLDV